MKKNQKGKIRRLIDLEEKDGLTKIYWTIAKTLQLPQKQKL